MSGGGAGKVYFVLYLAVVLELLIIIVERDEAEEHLMAKQKETMKIVESILSQLQSGAGTEGINTRPQDEITIPPEGGASIEEALGIKIKADRQYIIEVGVTDVSGDLKKKEGESEADYNERLKKLVKLGNVQELEYQIFYTPGGDKEDPSAPEFPSNHYIDSLHIDFTTFTPGQEFTDNKGNSWQFKGIHILKLDDGATYDRLDVEHLSMESFNPVYPKDSMVSVGDPFLPEAIPADSFYYYSPDDTKNQMGTSKSGDLKKRAFVVNFQPDKSQGGWYKLRFKSKTNRILGVRGEMIDKPVDDETKVNIGTVQLSVKDLRKVKKTLYTRLEEFRPPDSEVLSKERDIEKFERMLGDAIDAAASDENAAGIISNINLYGYIVQLLTPGMSQLFDQNRGAIEFDIRVIKPTPPPGAKPAIGLPKEDVAAFEKLPASFLVDISPYKTNGDNKLSGVVKQNGIAVEGAEITLKPLAEVQGGTVDQTLENKSVKYVASVNRALPVGQYTYEITHNLKNESDLKEGSMQIYEAALTAASLSQLQGAMNIRAKYGKELYFSAVPKSQGIPANQFRIYMSTDQYSLNEGSQKNYIEGLDVTRDQGMKICANANTLDVKVTWRNPITKEEVELFSEKGKAIRQDKPSVYDNQKSVTYKQIDMETIRMDIEGIKVRSKNSDCDIKKYADLIISVDGEGEVEANYKGKKYKYRVTVSGDSQKISDKEHGVSAEITLKCLDKIPRKYKTLSLTGIVTLRVNAQCKNNDNPNKVTSSMEKAKINIDVNYTVSKNKKKKTL